MSDIMLHGVLNMPLPDNPADLDMLTWLQFRNRARQASEEITALRSELILAEAAFDAVNEKLSTARSEGIREGLEMAAKVAEDEDGAITTWGEDQNTRVSQKTGSDIAAAIRAKIKEVKP